MKIYLVHPGENDSIYLTEGGVWQLNTLARRLINERIDVDRIYVNGHDVSRQSGHILSKILRVPIVSDERFVELNKKVILGNVDPIDLENLENINCFVDEVINKKKDAIITIGDGIHRFIISRLTGMSLQETRHFSLQSSGISTLYYDNSTAKWRINSINDVNHLRIP
jgi:broad specificity phosphatase PhoE